MNRTKITNTTNSPYTRVPDFPDAPPDVLETAALSKLRRLLRIRRDHAPELLDSGLYLLDRSIVACVADARGVGASEKARAIIKEVMQVPHVGR
jgi:hypothetical protein